MVIRFIPWCSNVQLYSINNCDNRENTMNKTSYRTVQSLRVRAHGDIKFINCAVQHVSAKLTLEVQVKCNKNK